MSLKDDRSAYKKLLGKEGYNPSLPFCILSKSLKLKYCNERMADILELSEDVDLEMIDVESIWKFNNDEMAGPAILRKLNSQSCVEENAVIAQWGTKSYKLESKVTDGDMIIVAQLIRKGDLLQDKESRQLLFRVISHEIRTNVQVLRGYIDMLPEDQILLQERMSSSVSRLNKVVQMLEDLKVELEFDKAS